MGSVNVWGLDEGSPTAAIDTGFVNRLIDSKVSKNGDELHGNLQMNGNKITGLPTDTTQIEQSDAVSFKICADMMVSNVEQIEGGEMKGNLYLKIEDDDIRELGCKDLKDHTEFSILLGNNQNKIQCEREDVDPQPIKLVTSNGVLFKTNERDFLKIGTHNNPYIIAFHRIQILAGIDACNSSIKNLQAPVDDNDAATKQYVDKKGRKCKTGLVPYLRANVDNKTGYVVSASSEHTTYLAYKAMKYGSGEWANFGKKSDFWFKVKCLEPVRVWRFTALGRGYQGHELISWRFEGSNDDTTWTVLRSESNYIISRTVVLVDVDTEEYFQYYRFFVVLAAGLNAGLAHFQLYVYSE